jgi:transforming growth factor-beta-induced protein
VVPGAIYAKDVAPGKVKTVLGQELTITSEDGGLFVDGAAILAVDITCTNGVIHVIDTVVLPTQAKTIAQVAAGNSAFSTLVGALDAANLVDALNSPGTYTVFAPTDDAFAALPEGALAALAADPTELTTTLLYHVLGATVLAKDVSTGVVETLSGIDLAIEVTGGVVQVGNALVTMTDIVCSNGVIHVIDKVLLPPSIVDIAASSPDFTTLVTALQVAELVATLQGDGPFTVFAPNNAAFAKIAEADLSAILADKELLTAILTYHVVPGKITTATIEPGTYATANGQSLTISASDGKLFANDAEIIATDIIGKNGVIHVIDSVLLPTQAKTIAQVVAESADHTTLEAALGAADLTAVLSGEGPFTVFAPTDAAFAVLGEQAVADLLANSTKLNKTLLYHVLAGKVMAADVTTGEATTASKIKLPLVKTEAGVQAGFFATKANVTVTDIVCSNGVIHVIDAVLLPPSVVDLAVATADFSTLVSLLTTADLVTTLSGNGPFTVFAPVNSGFAAISPQELDSLLADIPLLTSVLTYHVLAGEVPSSAVAPGQIQMLNGSFASISAEASLLFINSAQIIATDIYGWNGVIHVINGVLLPPPI